MSDCLFCKIAAGKLNTEFVYENDEVVAFNDLNPQAPIHILVIPKKHIATLNDLSDHTATIAAKLLQAAAEIAKQKGIDQAGYRAAFNCNDDGGQTVFHLHLHLLGGRRMLWPPG